MACSANALAFTRIKNGFENLTQSHLLPISSAVGGCLAIVFGILSYFDGPRYIPKIAQCAGIAVIISVTVDVLNDITNAF